MTIRRRTESDSYRLVMRGAETGRAVQSGSADCLSRIRSDAAAVTTNSVERTNRLTYKLTSQTDVTNQTDDTDSLLGTAPTQPPRSLTHLSDHS